MHFINRGKRVKQLYFNETLLLTIDGLAGETKQIFAPCCLPSNLVVKNIFIPNIEEITKLLLTGVRKIKSR